ncbi:hypothetical protein SAMN05444411_10299 [Lutibacter oricola]|uniref:Uncharacterized protein n=1 Tax=Lutibacter oricola TaxID=762486 RepID=A0A1H2W4H1_9FLAO|nr:hypothetical protein [Lutibacter oricola]SDW74979.1 hypothetical protein SAMN05444411_10299 [Lutibacter oricola]
MAFYTLPLELKRVIDSEKTDFTVLTKRNVPISKAIGSLSFSVVWLVFVSFFIFSFFGPLLDGDNVNFKVNDVPTTASLDNLKPLLVPGLMMGLFALIGIIMFGYGMFTLLQKGSYFVGTETRLIKYRKGKIETYDWEQFSGNIKIKSSGQSGNLAFELRTGKMKSRKNAPDKYVPNVIHMVGLKDVFKIEKKCRLRIKENDPTPRVIA